jgi:5-methylthioadenosine/S-adenosylhomocysteine deaminase
MRNLFNRLVYAALLAASLPAAGAAGADWSIAGTILSPNGIIADGTLSISDQKISSVGPSATVRGAANSIKVQGIILPGFIDLHNHLTWNILPRWVPGRKFSNRYEWQDSPEYDRVLSNPHYIVMGEVSCEAEIYAEIKALAGGATSTLGGLLKSPCTVGLVRNLDTDSGIAIPAPPASEVCPTKDGTDRTLLDVVDNEVFPLEVMHDRFDYLLCALGTGSLRGLVVHLSEGANSDSAAHREYSMLSKQVMIAADGKTPIRREGLALIHGSALRDLDFVGMKSSNVGLIWSPRSNDELYGTTTNIAAARQAGVEIAIAPDWSPSGSAGMLQEIGYASRHYATIGSNDLVAMATSVPAELVRIADHVGALAPGKLADFVVLNVSVDPTKLTPLDAIVRATPSDISLVVVGGKPVYGDRALLKRLLPSNTEPEVIWVCDAEKAVDLTGTQAAVKRWTFNDLKDHLNSALKPVGSSLAEIECD